MPNTAALSLQNAPQIFAWDLHSDDGNQMVFFAETIAVVAGNPNIQDFSRAPNSILHIKELKMLLIRSRRVWKTLEEILMPNLQAE